MGIQLQSLGKVTLPREKKKEIILPEPEVVIKAVIGTPLELPCLLSMWLSLRISEVRGLQFRDISPEGNYISVRRALVYSGGKDVLRDVNKTDSSTRTNALPPYLLEKISKIPHKSDEDFIINRGYNYLAKNFKKLMNQQGYDISLHKLRHIFASKLDQLNIPAVYIQKLGGWKTDIVMKTFYTHTFSEVEEGY